MEDRLEIGVAAIVHRIQASPVPLAGAVHSRA